MVSLCCLHTSCSVSETCSLVSYNSWICLYGFCSQTCVQRNHWAVLSAPLPQSSPCVSRSFSCLGCYLRSTLSWCVCLSRSTCMFLVELVRFPPEKTMRLLNCLWGHLFCTKSLKVCLCRFYFPWNSFWFLLSYNQPALRSVQPCTQPPCGGTALWVLSRRHQCRCSRMAVFRIRSLFILND